MKKIIIILAVLLTGFMAKAQQDPMFTKYMFNSLVVNPAYAGSQDLWDINATYRKQWIAFNGAPITILLGADGPLKDNRVGLGFTLFHDQIGVDKRTDLSLNYAYRIPTENGHFALGIKAGASFNGSDFSSLSIASGDPLYASNRKTTTPYVGVGLLYNTNNRNSSNYYFGLSSPTIFSFDINKKDSIPAFLKSHFYGHLGASFPIGESGIQLKPSVLINYQPAAPLQAHLNFSVLFRSAFSIGVSYRTGDAVNLNAVVFIKKATRIGFAYDITISELRKYNNGSFEIMIGHQFGKDVTKIITGRNL